MSRPTSITIGSKTITRCYHQCPYFSLDGGPSSVMYCGHPSFRGKDPYAGFIISHPDCDTGFPKACPLVTGAPKARKEWSPYEPAGRENLRAISAATSNEDLADAIEDAAASLNHEDEYAIPAYREAVRRLRDRLI